MDTRKFAEEAAAKVRKRLGSGYEVTVTETVKNNGTEKTGVCIRRAGENIGAVVYPDPTGITVDVDGILADYLKAPKLPLDGEGVLDFEKAKDRICFKLVNADRNSERLKDMPHKAFLDLAMVLFVFLDSDGMATVEVTDGLMDTWGVDEDTLWELAKKNTPRLLPEKMGTLSDFLSASFDDMGTYDCRIPLWVLTNERKHYGAGIICYDGVLDKMLEEVGCSLIVLPSSVHEVLVLKDDGSAEHEDLIRLVRVVNRTAVEPVDFLSDNIYLYQKGGWADRCLTMKG